MPQFETAPRRLSAPQPRPGRMTEPPPWGGAPARSLDRGRRKTTAAEPGPWLRSAHDARPPPPPRALRGHTRRGRALPAGGGGRRDDLAGQAPLEARPVG